MNANINGWQILTPCTVPRLLKANFSVNIEHITMIFTLMPLIPAFYTQRNVTSYSTHCNTAQIWTWCMEYSSSVVDRYPPIYVISCSGSVTSYSAIKLCFVINVLNIMLNLAEYPLILAYSTYGLVAGRSIKRYSARFLRTIHKYVPMAKCKQRVE